MNDYLKLLEKFKSSKKLVTIFSDLEAPSTCSVGYLHELDENWLALAHISPEGIEDGYVFRKMENVFRIDVGGKYEKKVENLYSQNLVRHENLYLKNEKGILIAAITEAIRTKKMVAINVMDGEDVVGHICLLSETFIIIERFTEFGEKDGQTVVPIEAITKLNYDNLDLRCINAEI